jgi:hypothetical protein
METLAFSARYDYAGASAGIQVPIELRAGQGRSVRIVAKLDTGASFCIFQRDYAEQLGIFG